MIRIILNEEHFGLVLKEAINNCRHRLFIATADLKDVHLRPSGRRRARSVFEALGKLADRQVLVRILHSGIPSGPLLERLKKAIPNGLTMRRCTRTHTKAVIVDGRSMYLGSANLTGAGLGAKSPTRRNFEAGIWTDEVELIDQVLEMLEDVWSGQQCPTCGRRDHCPVPLEEPQLWAGNPKC